MTSELVTGNSADNQSLKYIELKKFQLSANELPNNSHNLLAVNNELQLIAVAVDGLLNVIPFQALLNYEYNKKVVNEIDAGFNQYVARISLGQGWTTSLVSIGGHQYGNTVAVFGSSGGRAVGQFFTLDEIVARRNETSPFAVVNSLPDREILDAAWHPEHYDNLIATCTDSGSIVVINVDAASRQAAIINQAVGFAATCLSWSPKGKQIVVGCSNGNFKQFKHDKGRRLELVKNIAPHPQLQAAACGLYKLHWQTASLFVAVYQSQDPTADPKRHVTLISMAPKSTTPQFSDFGPICMDSLMLADVVPTSSAVTDSVELISTPDSLMIASSISPEVGVIGCTDPAAINDLSKWAMWNLDDSGRVELPMTKSGDESFPRGVALASGIASPLITLSETEKYANSPILYVLTSRGLLCPYAVVNQLAAVKLHGKTAKTYLPLSSADTSQDFQSQQSMPAPVHQQPFMVQTQPIIQPPQHQPPHQVPQPQHQPQHVHQPPPPAYHQPPVANVTPQKSEISRNVQSTQSGHGDGGPQKNVYLLGAQKEIKAFNNELKSRLNNLRKSLTTSVGSPQEMDQLKQAIERVSVKCTATESKMETDNRKLTESKQQLMETLIRAEDAKSIVDRDTNSEYLKLAKSRSLHPIHSKKFNDLTAQFQYIETQLDEIETRLEKDWLEMRASNSSSSLSAGKPSGSSHGFGTSPNSKYSILLKTVLSNEKLIEAFEKKLKRSQNIAGIRPPQTVSTSELINLERLMKRSSLAGGRRDSSLGGGDVSPPIKSLSAGQRESLWNFLEVRHRVPVRKCAAADKSIHAKLAELDKAKHQVDAPLHQARSVERSHHHSVPQSRPAGSTPQVTSSAKPKSTSHHQVSHQRGGSAATTPSQSTNTLPQSLLTKPPARLEPTVKIPETVKERLTINANLQQQPPRAASPKFVVTPAVSATAEIQKLSDFRQDQITSIERPEIHVPSTGRSGSSIPTLVSGMQKSPSASDSSQLRSILKSPIQVMAKPQAAQQPSGSPFISAIVSSSSSSSSDNEPSLAVSSVKSPSVQPTLSFTAQLPTTVENVAKPEPEKSESSSSFSFGSAMASLQKAGPPTSPPLSSSSPAIPAVSSPQPSKPLFGNQSATPSLSVSSPTSTSTAPVSSPFTSPSPATAPSVSGASSAFSGLGFGSSSSSSSSATPTANPFGGTPSQVEAPKSSPFTLFGAQSSPAVSSSSSSLFGNAPAAQFGQAPKFGGAPAFGLPAQPAPASGASGAGLFGARPVFGASPAASPGMGFGAPPVLGGGLSTAAGGFGSSPKIESPVAQVASGGGGNSSGFGRFASSDLTFGTLASSPAPSFGSLAAQQQQQPQQQQQQFSQPAFGMSSPSFGSPPAFGQSQSQPTAFGQSQPQPTAFGQPQPGAFGQPMGGGGFGGSPAFGSAPGQPSQSSGFQPTSSSFMQYR